MPATKQDKRPAKHPPHLPPDKTRMPAPVADIKRRLASMLYESLVIFSILLIGFWLPQATLAGFGIVSTPRQLWAHIFLLLLAYFGWCWLNGGQTLAMKTWKLKIVDRSNKGLRPLQVLLRYLAAWPSILFFGIGIIWALADRDRQFLHDRIAGTKVVDNETTNA